MLASSLSPTAFTSLGCGCSAVSLHTDFLKQHKVSALRSFSARRSQRKHLTGPVCMSRRSDNFIDKTFTVVADILLKVLPTSEREREAFAYYRAGMTAQSEGEYAEALQNYYEAMRLEVDPYDRGYILYNIGLLHTSNGEHTRAMEYYLQAVERNPALPQAFNNMAVICQYRGEQALGEGDPESSESWFDQAANYWKQALALAPGNYMEAQNWLKSTGRG